MSDRQIILFYRKPHHQQLMGTVKSFPQDSEVVLLAQAHPFLKHKKILVFMVIFCYMLSFWSATPCRSSHHGIQSIPHGFSRFINKALLSSWQSSVECCPLKCNPASVKIFNACDVFEHSAVIMISITCNKLFTQKQLINIFKFVILFRVNTLFWW